MVAAGRDDASPSLGRAAEVFEFEGHSVRSPMVEQVWQTRSTPDKSFISVAASHWEMVVTRQEGATQLTVLGPETRATTASIPENALFFGIRFSLGTFMPRLPPSQLVDSAVTLPLVTNMSFWLNGHRLELPRVDDVDAFVATLVRAGLLVHDPVAPAALRGDIHRLSARSVERRVSRATGLTLGGIRQLRRRTRRQTAVRRRAAARRRARRRLRGPTAPDAVAQTVHGADAGRDLGLRVWRLAVVFVQDVPG